MRKRIVIGLIATVALLGVARRLSVNRPRDVLVEHAGRAVRHRTVFEQVGPGEPAVRLTIEPFDGVTPSLLIAGDEGGDVMEAPMARTGDGVWEGRLPGRSKGERLYYAFRVSVSGSGSVRIPGGSEGMFLVKYKGEVSGAVLVLHVVFMFGALFFMILSFWGALNILAGREGKNATVGVVRWVMLTTFAGGWPLGFMLNYQRFGVLWEGFPFGYDITDNKTQVIFVFWLVTALLVRGSFFGRGEARDAVGERVFASAVIVSFIVSLALYMIPHSL